MAVALPVTRTIAAPRPDWRSAALLALWGVPTAVALGQIYIEQTLAGASVDWPVALWTTVPNWALWALMTPAVAWLALRFGPGRAPAWQIGAVHAGGAALALGFHALGNVAAFRLGGLPAEWTLTDVQTHYTLRAHVNAVAYALVVAATWAWAAAKNRQQRETREAALRASLAEAELEALRTQLRPHFLFNALHAVGATVRKGEGDRAVTMLSSLGDLLRMSLESDGADEVPLRRELDVLDRYLALEQTRFADRLTVDVDASDDARRAYVPAWVLQPLLENALKHGIAPKPGPATVQVRASREADDLVITVTDDGVGLGGTQRGVPSTGVGMANTRARLDALYGPDAALTLTPGPDGTGAEARLTLPFRPA